MPNSEADVRLAVAHGQQIMVWACLLWLVAAYFVYEILARALRDSGLAASIVAFVSVFVIAGAEKVGERARWKYLSRLNQQGKAPQP